MKKEIILVIRRLAAFAMDWVVVIIWGGVLFATVMMFTAGNPPQPANPWAGQIIGILAMTLPVTLYFSILESSKLQASLGKRMLGLVVLSETGEQLSFYSALVRNVIKFIPWEIGHMVAQQAAYSTENGIPAWVWLPIALSLLGPTWWLAGMFLQGRTPYDQWAKARVTLTIEKR